MTKKKTAEDPAAEKEKKAPAKKPRPQAKKAPAKKPRPQAKKAPKEPVQAELAPVAADVLIDALPEIADIIEAEIIAETPADAFVPEVAAGEISQPTGPDGPMISSLSEEEQELSTIYGDDLSASTA